MDYYKLLPQRPSNIWSYSDVDGTGTPRKIVFAYDFWSAEPIFQDISIFFVRRSIAHVLRCSELTGCSAQDVLTIRSREYRHFDALGAPAPDEPEAVAWLRVYGRHGIDDFGLQHGALIASERAVSLLKNHGLTLCRVQKYDPDYLPEPLPESREEKEAIWQKIIEEAKRDVAKQVDAARKAEKLDG